MNWLLVFIIAFSISMGLAIGWRLPYLLERQAFEELVFQLPVSLKNLSIPSEKSQTRCLGEDFADWFLKVVLAQFLFDNKNYLRKMDLAQLAKAAGIQPKYDNCLRSVTQCLHRGQYNLAGKYAKSALVLRPLSTPHVPLKKVDGKYPFNELYALNDEEYFAENLCSLGRYSEAKSLILSLPELPTMTPTFCTGPLVGYRRGKLAQALLGLREYEEVHQKLSKPIPDLIETNGTWSELEFLQGLAYLAQKKATSAKTVFSKWEKRLDGPSELEMLLFRIPIRIDETRACNVAKEIIRYFEQHQPDPTTPQCLDYSGAIMEAYGHKSAAALLFIKANEIRQQ